MPNLPRIWRPPGETLPRGKWRVFADFPLAALAFVWSFKTFTFMPLATAATLPLVIASVTLLLLVGIPLLFIETGIGQMTGYGSAMALRRMCPLLGGTGFVVILHAIILCMQYSVFGAWSLYYGYAMIREVLVHSPLSTLPLDYADDDVSSASTSLKLIEAADWRLLHCNNEYNTDLCVKITDWNACNISWLEVQSEEAMQESADVAIVTATVLTENVTSSWLGAVGEALATTVGPLLNRRRREHDDISSSADAGATLGDGHYHGQSSITSAEQRFLDSNAFRRDYEDGRHCVASSEEYFTHYVLKVSASLSDIGGPVEHLIPCILIVWILAFLAASKGTRTLAKLAWIVMISSLFILVSITMGTWSLLDLTVVDDFPSASSTTSAAAAAANSNITKPWLPISDGVITGEKPHNSIFDISVWMQAAEFVLITILFGTGNLTTLASYNRRRHNLIRDVFVIGFGHLGICLLVNANMTQWLQFVIDTARRRAGLQFDFHEWRDWTLLFIVSPLVIKRQAHALLWAMLFYIMTFLVALSTLYTAVETLANFVQDEYLERWRNRTTRVTGVVCVVGFLLSLFFITRAGVFWLKLINHFINATSLITMLLIVVLVFVFGIERFEKGMRRSIYGAFNSSASSASCENMAGSIPARVGGYGQEQKSTPVLPRSNKKPLEDTRGRWFFTYFHYGCYASVVVIILTLVWILIINSPPLQYYGSGKPYPLWAKLVCLLMALVCLSPVVIYPLWCAFSRWPELRDQQRQESEYLHQSKLMYQNSFNSASSASISRAGRENRMSTSDMRRGDSEILRRLNLYASPSSAAIAPNSTAAAAAAAGAGRVRHPSRTPSRQLSASDGLPVLTTAADKVRSEEDSLLVSNGNNNNKQRVKFYRENSEDESTHELNTPESPQTPNGQVESVPDDDKKRVKFAAQPLVTEAVLVDRIRCETPPADGSLSETAEKKTSIYAKLLAALITPHSYKLSINDTGEDDDFNHGAYGDDNDDDEEDKVFYGRHSKKKQKHFENEFAMRLSSAREDDDIVVHSGRNSRNNSKGDTDDIGNSSSLLNNHEQEHANLEFLNIPISMGRRASLTPSSLMGSNRLANRKAMENH